MYPLERQAYAVLLHDILLILVCHTRHHSHSEEYDDDDDDKSQDLTIGYQTNRRNTHKNLRKKSAVVRNQNQEPQDSNKGSDVTNLWIESNLKSRPWLSSIAAIRVEYSIFGGDAERSTVSYHILCGFRSHSMR